MVEALVQSLLGLPPLAYPLLLATCLGAYLFFWFVFVRGTPCRSKQRMDGKTVIVTGANTGIGKITAEELARRGARVVMACRDMARGRAALSEVREGAGSENVVLRQLDLASCDSIRAFAELVLKEEQAIHVLVCNAGVMFVPFQKTVDGFELTFGVNHLGHFLLTNLLLDRIKESAPARIVVVSSRGHYFTRGLNFDDLMLMRSYGRYEAYFRSKLANVMFGHELAKRLEGTGVSVYSLHPGSIRTEIGRHTFTGWTFFLKVCVCVCAHVHACMIGFVHTCLGGCW